MTTERTVRTCLSHPILVPPAEDVAILNLLSDLSVVNVDNADEVRHSVRFFGIKLVFSNFTPELELMHFSRQAAKLDRKLESLIDC